MKKSEKILNRIKKREKYEKSGDTVVLKDVPTQILTFEQLARAYRFTKARLLRQEALRDKFWPGQDMDPDE
jgi:hypothetical protein